MTRKARVGMTLGAVTAIVVGVLTAIFVSQPKPIQTESGILLDAPRALPAFTLVAGDGGRFGRSELQGHWSLLFAGYTHCPDVCPNTMAVLKSVAARLRDEQLGLQVVFISIDPERDTPENIGRYAAYFDPTFIAATGPVEELDKLAAGAGLVYVKVPGKTADSYTMDHSAALVLVDPQARIAGYFTPPHDADRLAADLAKVIRAGGPAA